MNYTERELREKKQIIKASTILVVLITLIACGGLVGCPRYKVYSETMKGTAELERAKQNRQIQIEEAQAENVAWEMKAQTEIKVAEANAQAEIIRAQGVAEANKIIGESLKGNEGYLHYLWIQSLQDEHGERVYIPTEANLPILEAK